MNNVFLIKDPFNELVETNVWVLDKRKFKRLFVHYIVEFRVVSGYVEIFGSVFKGSPHYKRIVAPGWLGSYCFKLACLEALQIATNEKEKKNATCYRCLGYCGQTSGELCNLVYNVGIKDKVVCCFKDVKTIFGVSSSQFMITKIPAFSNVLKIQHKNWNDVINKVILQILTRKNKNNVLFHQPMMVYGQNGIGKSNFCCFLINKLLTLFNKVCLLETDLGQPLLTAPGLVSLHMITEPLLGASHALQKTCECYNDKYFTSTIPLLSMFGYGVASDANPEMYIEAVGECHLKYQQLISGALLEAVKSDTETKNISVVDIYSPFVKPSSLLTEGFISKTFASNDEIISLLHQFRENSDTFSLPVPLVINTHGWVTGLGWQLLDTIGSMTWSTIGLNLSTITTPHCQSTEADCDNPKIISTHVLPHLTSSFQSILDKYCGRFPIPWIQSPETILYHLTSFVPSSIASQETIPPASKRWLRFAAHLNQEFASALHVYPTTQEEFYHGSIVSSFVKYPKEHCCQHINLPLWHSNEPCVSLVSGYFRSASKLQLEDIEAILTAQLVAVGRIRQQNDALQKEGYFHEHWPPLVLLSPTHLEVFFYGWIHSFDSKNGTVMMYIPCWVNEGDIQSINALGIGSNIRFLASPSHPTKCPPFPDETILASIQKNVRVRNVLSSNTFGKPGLLPATVAFLNDLSVPNDFGKLQLPYQRSDIFQNLCGGKRSSNRNHLPRFSQRKEKRNY